MSEKGAKNKRRGDVFMLEMDDTVGGVRGAAEDGERGMPESDDWEDSIQIVQGPTRGRDQQ
jgi:hypothetical protein